jgi:hypothetical protein
LAIFLDHMKVISRVHPALEQYPTESSIQAKAGGNATHVFTAYLKNSVTRSVEPLRVIDWRMAVCFVGGMSVPQTRLAVQV